MSEQILFVDDDVNILSAFKRQLRKSLELETAPGGAQALDLIQNKGPFAVIISDQQMPEMDGLSFLKEAEKCSPDSIRIMLTGNADQETAINAINDGHIFRFLTKPCSSETVLGVVNEALAVYRAKLAERQLLERTLAGSVKLLIDILSMQNGAAFTSTTRMRSWARAMLPHLARVDSWQLYMAVMFSGLGQITLPPEVQTKLQSKAKPTAEEAALVEQSPRVARDLIRNIPRLETIANAVYYQNKGYDGSGFPDEGHSGDEIPLIGRILKILIDLAKESDVEHPPPQAWAELNSRPQLYDPKLLLAAARALAAPSHASEEIIRSVAMDVKIYQMKEGDKTLDDIKGENDEMILAAGFELTRPMIQKIRQISQLKKLKEPIRVQRLED